MERETLANPPLVEAIFELRWKLQDLGNGLKRDPQYRIMLGRISDLAEKSYPFTEELETARFPDDMVPYIVQHRFRCGEGKWPLIQIGPGIATLNSTENYTWPDFKQSANNLLDILYKARPDRDSFQVDTLLLRYVDAIDFDFEKGDILWYLREKMKIDVKLQEALFSDSKIKSSPSILDLRFAFALSNPTGVIHLRLERGKKAASDALVLQTMIQSTSEDVPPNEKGAIKRWVTRSHTILDDWFFKLIAEIKGDFK